MNDAVCVDFALMSERAAVPRRAHAEDAGMDLAVPVEVRVPARGEREVDFEVAVAVPEGYVGLLVPRSSTGFRMHTALSNTVGVIDAGYTGSIRAKLRNFGPKPVWFRAGQYVVQLILVPIPRVELMQVEVGELGVSDRGDGGVGSTGYLAAQHPKFD